MKRLAIVTARGGSKRIPRKNVKPFLGKPILAWSIEAALGSGLFDEVMISTDDDEIAEIAQSYGATFPFRRSAASSDDYATTADVLLEVITCYRDRGVKWQEACCLYPTAPFVTPEKLRTARARLVETGADVVLPVARFGAPIWRSFRMEAGRLRYIWPEHSPKRSQDLPPAYHDAGQFYFFRPEALLRTGQLVTDNAVGIEVPELEVQDIDTEEDWKLAELKFKDFLQRTIGSSASTCPGRDHPFPAPTR